MEQKRLCGLKDKDTCEHTAQKLWNGSGKAYLVLRSHNYHYRYILRSHGYLISPFFFTVPFPNQDGCTVCLFLSFTISENLFFLNSFGDSWKNYFQESFLGNT